MKKNLFILNALLILSGSTFAQDITSDTLAKKLKQPEKKSYYVEPVDDVLHDQFKIDIEYRPRTELRRGYRSLPNDTLKAAFFTSHRARINLDYKRDKFLFHTSFQDIRVWGDTDPRDATGKAQFFEFYVEPSLSDKISVRVGRQRIIYDNQRLFGENNWRQAGGQHDAVRFIYKGDKLEADLIGAFNQTKANEFGTPYDVSWDLYRSLAASFLKYKATDKITLTGINFSDEYTDPASGDTVGYWKFTNGGRIEYENESIYLTFAGYYQWGKIESGKQHNAYYLEPEVKWKASKKYSARLGAQILSGDNNKNDNKSTAFLVQVGAFHRFNGRMDYTQRTVRTYENEGVVNPYLIQDFKPNKKLKISWESHLLGTQSQLTRTENGKEINLDKLYAWENDFRFQYKANKFTNIELAYMFLAPTSKTLTSLRTGQNGSTDNIAQFAYLAITWTPEILNWKR